MKPSHSDTRPLIGTASIFFYPYLTLHAAICKLIPYDPESQRCPGISNCQDVTIWLLIRRLSPFVNQHEFILERRLVVTPTWIPRGIQQLITLGGT